MNRLQLFELHELGWCPAEVRDSLTDLLRATIRIHRCYAPIERRLADAVLRNRPCRVVDLCSGGGGPWPSMQESLSEYGCRVKVRLSDKSPNLAAFERIRALSRERVEFAADPVDATRVSADMAGFRTMFTAFHHFDPETAEEIVANAAARKQGIAVFEMTQRSAAGILFMLFAFVFALAAVPFLRPFRWSRLFWTYAIPLVPLALMLDGIVSCLRTYSAEEFKTMAARHADYHWEIGEARGSLWPIPITYMIGHPQAVTAVGTPLSPCVSRPAPAHRH